MRQYQLQGAHDLLDRQTEAVSMIAVLMNTPEPSLGKWDSSGLIENAFGALQRRPKNFRLLAPFCALTSAMGYARSHGSRTA